MKLRLFVLAAIVFSLAAFKVDGQTRPKATAAQALPSLMASLPESDGVAQVKLHSLLNEVLPQVLATNPSKLAEISADLDRFKTRTGLDARSFDQLALGVKYTYPSPGITKLQTVALATGTFNSGAMVAAGRAAADGKYREEKYQGKTIYIFTVEENISIFVDQKKYFVFTNEHNGKESWPFDQPAHLLLNVAVGGDWPKNPDATSQFPQQMLVDYVRVYSHK